MTSATFIKVDPRCTSEVSFHGIGRGSSDRPRWSRQLERSRFLHKFVSTKISRAGSFTYWWDAITSQCISLIHVHRAIISANETAMRELKITFPLLRTLSCNAIFLFDSIVGFVEQNAISVHREHEGVQ